MTDTSTTIRLSVGHDEMDGLLRVLHSARVPMLGLELTGPGWVVILGRFQMSPLPDLSAYRRLP